MHVLLEALAARETLALALGRAPYMVLGFPGSEALTLVLALERAVYGVVLFCL